MSTNQQVEGVGPVVFQKLGGEDRGIAVYGLNSPKDKNALGFELLESMKEVNQLIREDTKISVVILHSLVKGIFCAGECQCPVPFTIVIVKAKFCMWIKKKR